jgi:uncharacterized membrane protein
MRSVEPMGNAFSVDPTTVVAILAMAGVTYFTRFAGLVLVRFVTLRGRTRAALEAVPAAVLMAVIAPTVFAQGPAEAIAAAVTAVAATRLPMLATIAIGTASVVALRYALAG